MDAENVQPSVPKSAKRSIFIRVLTYALGIVFFILVGFIIGRVSLGKCGRFVLGTQTSSGSLLSSLQTLLNVNPKIPTQVIYTVQATPAPTSKPNQWPTFPTATVTPQPNQWPHPTALTPTPQPTSAPLPPTKIKQIVNNMGITLTNPTITTGTDGKNITVKGEIQNKILGLISISNTVVLNVNRNGGITESITKPWWQKIFTNPFAGLIKCTSLIGETSCIKNGCSYWSDCGKCEDVTAPYDPACSCDTIKGEGDCNTAASCEWRSECAGGGACAVVGESSKGACGGCQNIIGTDTCNKMGSGCFIDSNCGRCEDPTVPDPSCTCASVKSKSGCDRAVSCEWRSECAGGGACASLIANTKVACGGCGNIIGVNACNKQGSGCRIDSNCGRCEENSFVDPSCTCNSVKTKSGCDAASNCKWHPECAGGGVCASWFDSTDTYVNSKVACGGCANINGKSECNNAGCIYSNNQCQ